MSYHLISVIVWIHSLSVTISVLFLRGFIWESRAFENHHYLVREILFYFIFSHASRDFNPSACLESFGDFMVRQREWFQKSYWVAEVTVQIMGLNQNSRDRREVDTLK